MANEQNLESRIIAEPKPSLMKQAIYSVGCLGSALAAEICAFNSFKEPLNIPSFLVYAITAVACYRKAGTYRN